MPITVEYNIGRVKFLVPVKLTRTLHSRERYLSAPYKNTACKMCVDQAYRKAWRTFNDNFSRTATGTEIPKDTFIMDVINEGLALIKAKKDEARRVLVKFGFDPDTGKYRGDSLPPELCNKQPDYVSVDPVDIILSIDASIKDDEDILEAPWELGKAEEDSILEMAQQEVGEEQEGLSQDGPEASVKAMDEKEYSQPDTDVFQYHPKRRGPRRDVNPDERQSIADGYVKWMDTLSTENACKIIHAWKVEKDESQIAYISVDAVLVPEQAEKHVKGGKEYLPTKRKNVSHWNIRVDFDNQSYHVTALERKEAFLQLIAFLLENGLFSRYLVFFTDGETEIFTDINEYFAPWEHRTYLDFFHIRKKTFELLSMALVSKKVGDPRGKVEYYVKGPKKGQIKKQDTTSLSILYARRVSRMLWVGNYLEAIDYLKNINPSHIRNREKLEELITKYENKGQYMTCYALRRRLGLRNSSNVVENSNNILVSDRQKGDDSYWREKGSGALASLSAIYRNDQNEDWFIRGSFSFKLKEQPRLSE